eukprot:Phypoly_transcript_23576.p1 GENE.Phypoly_transcript_23576~~Phypoly_transcript_23576.p1  ORF type:complete len:154 (+),score=12.55 Phypoly_transcript_23576:49-510(+)
MASGVVRVLTLRVKQGETESVHNVEIHPNTTVLEMKQQVTAENLRFIYQGRELQDAQLVSECNIPQNAVILTARSFRTPSSTSTPSAVYEPDPIWLKWLGSSYTLVVVLGVLLAAFWIALVQYGGLVFGPSGILFLIILTVAWSAASFFHLRV